MGNTAWLVSLTAFNALELILGVVLIMAGVVVANVVRQHPVFHPNLMRLVASVFVHWLAATLCRFAMVVWLFFDRRQLGECQGSFILQNWIS